MVLSPLHKAAVLVASLDLQTADCLVDRLPSDQAAQLRNAILALTEDIDEAVDQVIDDFLIDSTATAANGEPGERFDSVDDDTRASYASADARTWNNSHQDTIASLKPETLEALRHERPQVIAATLAITPARQAAAVMEQLSVELRADIMRRMAKLGPSHLELIRQLWEDVENPKQERPQPAALIARDSLAAVERILRVCPAAERDSVLEHLAHADPQFAELLHGNTAPAVPLRAVPLVSEVAT